MISEADVVVVGSGGLGAATAYYLAKCGGYRVALLDKHNIGPQAGAGRLPALRQSRELLINAFAVTTAAWALDVAIQDAERGQRGYLLTSDSSYLEPYRTGSRDAPVLLARFK